MWLRYPGSASGIQAWAADCGLVCPNPLTYISEKLQLTFQQQVLSERTIVYQYAKIFWDCEGVMCVWPVDCNLVWHTALALISS